MSDAATQKFVEAVRLDVVKLFEGRDRQQGADFLSRLTFIVGNYADTQPLRDSNDDIRQHRDRLKRIQEAARLLSALLKNEPLNDFLLNDYDIAVTPHPSGKVNDILRAVHGCKYTDLACARLQELVISLYLVDLNADRLLNDPGELASWRVEYRPAHRNAKPWRTYIWDPLFSLMSEFDVSVPVTTRGPMIRVLTAIHEALGLEPLDPEAVKKAAEAFRKGKVASGK